MLINDILARQGKDMATINTRQEMRTSYRKLVYGQGELLDAVTDRVSAIDLLDISAGGIPFLSTSMLQKDSI